MRYDIDRPKELVFKITFGRNKGTYVRFRKKRSRWHLVSSSKNISYTQAELDKLVQEGCLEWRT